MGWGGGTKVAVDIICAPGVQVLEDSLRKGVFEGVLAALEAQDWDNVQEAMEIDSAFDEVVREKYPSWFVDEES